MSSYPQLVDQDIRLSILQLLEEDPDYTHNEAMLRSLLRRLRGHGIGADKLRTELRWLEEQGLLRLEDGADLWVARITARGADVATGMTRAPGVARPLPEM